MDISFLSVEPATELCHVFTVSTELAVLFRGIRLTGDTDRAVSCKLFILPLKDRPGVPGEDASLKLLLLGICTVSSHQTLDGCSILIVQVLLAALHSMGNHIGDFTAIAVDAETVNLLAYFRNDIIKIFQSRKQKQEFATRESYDVCLCKPEPGAYRTCNQEGLDPNLEALGPYQLCAVLVGIDSEDVLLDSGCVS